MSVPCPEEAYLRLLESHLDGAAESQQPAWLDRRDGGGPVPIDELADLHAAAMKRMAAERPELDLVANSSACLAPLIEMLRASSDALQSEREARTRIREALRESERLLLESQRIARVGSYVFDAGLGTWTSTTTLDEILGVAVGSERTLQSWIELVHPDERQELAAHWAEEVLAQHRAFDRTYRILRRTDGVIRSVHGRGEWELDAGGQPKRLLGTIQDVTDRMQVEERAAGFSNLLRDSLNEIYFFDAETYRFAEVSRGACENLGYSMDELRAMTPLDIKPGFSAAEFTQRLEPLRTGVERRLLIATEHRRKDGSLYPVEVHLQLNKGVAGDMFAAIIVDLTEREMVERALVASEKRMEWALHGADLGTWDWNLLTGEVAYNERWVGMLGYTHAELGSGLDTWQRLVHPEDLARIQPMLDAHLAGLTDAYESEHRLQHKSGGWVWVLDRGRVIERDPEGRPLRACGTHLDITQRKEAELASSLSSAALAAAQKIAHLGSWAWDIKAGTESWSAEQFRIFGHEPDAIEPTYERFIEAVHPTDRERVTEAVRATLEEDHPYDLSFRILRPDGSQRAVHAKGDLERDADGAPMRMLGTVLDITAREEAQEERERAQRAVQEAYAEVRALKDRLQAENILLRREVQVENLHSEIVGDSPALREALRSAEEVAATDVAVLLLGETGTGKELFARAIHRMSSRSAGPLISVNCAALPEALMERELFGSEAGAFTGALERTIGRFEAADGGTLLLDEVGELAPQLQAKLLRVLENGDFERLGGTETVQADVRVIAATNADLDQRVQDGGFRADLLYRLDVFPITLPPLRDRDGDIPRLVEAFALALAEKMGKRIDEITNESMHQLAAYDWPGNVRELRNVVERALIRTSGSILDIQLPAGLGATTTPRATGSQAMADVERGHMLQVLESVGWRIRGAGGAAERLALKPSTLESRMRKHGLRRP